MLCILSPVLLCANLLCPRFHQNCCQVSMTSALPNPMGVSQSLSYSPLTAVVTSHCYPLKYFLLLASWTSHFPGFLPASLAILTAFCWSSSSLHPLNIGSPHGFKSSAVSSHKNVNSMKTGNLHHVVLCCVPSAW